MQPFSYPKPVKPTHLVRESELMDRINRVVGMALRERSYGYGARHAEALASELRQVQEAVTPEERAAEHRYRLEVRKYNEAVEAYNEQLKAARQARVNARQVAQVRAAACQRCYSTHAGDC